MKGKNSELKYKSLYNKSETGITTQIGCIYNLNTNKIGIYSVFRKTPGYSGGFETNRECTQFLGIYIAEQVLSKLFKNIERMSNNNPGYDFICGNGHKVDCKSSCYVKNRPSWSFIINHNHVAEYFLCLAFDNRDDLNPLHVWLIPGNIINNLMHASISKSTIDKWSEYEQPLDEVLKCCNEMKVKS